MKVLITGATGFIGSQILHQLILRPEIISVIAISRRELPVTDDKLQIILMHDFKNWKKDVLDQIADADAMIWAIGSYVGDEDVDINYPIAFQNAFIGAMAKDRRKKFRYVHLSGAFCETDERRPLWFLEHARKVRGRAQVMSLQFAVEHEDVWECYVVRPGGVVQGDSWWKWMAEKILGVDMVIRGDVLGIFIAHMLASGGDYDQRVIGNRQMVEEGTALLMARR